MSNIDKVYTKKQQEIYRDVGSKDWFILILHGAKRSGKTQLNNDLFLRELIRVKKIANMEKVDKPQYILAGFSKSTIYQNVLIELSSKYGIDFKFDKLGNFTMLGVYVVQVGHGKIDGLGRIRGMTSYGAYVNEASLANELVFDEIRSRCSGKGARIICDTNPDNPEHWLKKEYIDNPTDRILSYKFTIFDNTFLDKRYLQSTIDTTPDGMFTERNIYGNWVSGEGVVYKGFDPKRHYVKSLDGIRFSSYIAGVDWGYGHYGSIVVFGISNDGKYYMIEEHAEQYQEIDFWVAVAKDIANRYKGIVFYCDSARVEHIDRFSREGLVAYMADKAVIPGIEAVSILYKTDKLFIYEYIAKRFKEEIYSYVWATNYRSDEVKKEFDDVMDSMRYALYSYEQGLGSIKTMDRSVLGL
ncbi:phage terminase, large subunit, PBSX family [Anaerococcus prevotii]|uniref:Phage terminase, large subunit, PBSX family n=1 Tax=Anaerococcus prevotii (strain ATCC 9321 / DSM 20548 / JCM 6508 / NCTC 11806 / PC1) TaxID=525919 RepID=C7RHA1_ANAPD|nr:PBSX family phage terminase large subunit [Anaerococcus prevotii]ACV28862.1 phage terminase, large subunit, PBSX family [Anaerococcus prevotii DSM 20548]SUU94536.1 phage terminase, large subunit, PBSX family [Anaerococcus prevotii]